MSNSIHVSLVENNYSNQQNQDISGVSLSAIVLLKLQYLSKRNSNVPVSGNNITPEQRRINNELAKKGINVGEQKVSILEKIGLKSLQ